MFVMGFIAGFFNFAFLARILFIFVYLKVHSGGFLVGGVCISVNNFPENCFFWSFVYFVEYFQD